MTTLQPIDYINMTDLITGRPDLWAKCRCCESTLVNWGKRYMVDGWPLGIKVGGEFRISPTLLVGFLQGRGLPKIR
jgi:hypothetical protein